MAHFFMLRLYFVPPIYTVYTARGIAVLLQLKLVQIVVITLAGLRQYLPLELSGIILLETPAFFLSFHWLQHSPLRNTAERISLSFS